MNYPGLSRQRLCPGYRRHPGNTELFLDALVAGNFLEKKNNLYWNVPVAQAFLVEAVQPTWGCFLSDHRR